MKTRYGFVSNSSSSSFMIDKLCLTDLQLYAIRNHVKVAKEMLDDFFIGSREDEWNITETDEKIKGYTSMDNFDMEYFLKQIGVPGAFINFGDYDIWDDEYEN